MPFKYATEEERITARKESIKRRSDKYHNSDKFKVLQRTRTIPKQHLLRKTNKRAFLYVTYNNMKRRVLGKTATRHIHLYKGLPILEWLDFVTWSMYDKEFDRLFNIWVANSNDRKLCPSINRIDSLKGYTIDNMEWMTHSENSRLGAISRHNGGSIR